MCSFYSTIKVTVCSVFIYTVKMVTVGYVLSLRIIEVTVGYMDIVGCVLMCYCV